MFEESHDLVDVSLDLGLLFKDARTLIEQLSKLKDREVRVNTKYFIIPEPETGGMIRQRQVIEGKISWVTESPSGIWLKEGKTFSEKEEVKPITEGEKAGTLDVLTFTTPPSAFSGFFVLTEEISTIQVW